MRYTRADGYGKEKGKMRETDALLLERLKRPQRKIDVALDSGTYNEMHDQFALE